jgi:hypothetical protein
MSQQLSQQTGLSLRNLCGVLALPCSTFQRWRHRHLHGQPVCRTPGPRPVPPLPLEQLRQQIKELPHGMKRTRHTTRLRQEQRDAISRRQLQELIRQERHQRNWIIRHQWQRVTWLQPNVAWATDATEYLPDQQGRKLQLIGVQDLASSYRLEPAAALELSGEQVAQLLATHFEQHGAPLFLKRDNGSIFNDACVDALLAEHGVIPLNSPRAYPRYNGAIEKGLRELKASFEICLPVPPQWEPGQLRPFILAGLCQENLKPRRRLHGQCAQTVYHERTRMRWTKRQRHEIFEWLREHSEGIVNKLESNDQQNRQRAWRAAALTWLRRQGLITLSQNQKTVTPFSTSKVS